MFEQNPMIGPGTSGAWNHTLEILLMLLGAFVLGYLLSYFLSRIRLDKLVAELDVEKRHRRTLEGDFDRVRAEHSSMGSRISTLEGDLTKDRALIAELHQTQEGYLQELTELRSRPSEKMTSDTSELDALRTQLQQCQSEHGNLRADLALVRGELAASKAGKEAANAELERERVRVAEANLLLEQVHAQLDEKTRSVTETLPAVGMTGELFAASLSAPLKPDDLKIIEGVGPKINELLLQAGIKSFVALSETPIDHLKQILHDAGERFRIHDPSSWPEQALLCAKGEWEALKVLQAKLSAGRVR